METDDQITKLILNEIKQHFKDIVLLAKPNIQNGIKNIVIHAIKSEPEYNSLLTGQLRGEFGIVDPSTKVDAILDIWSKDIETTVTDKAITIQMIQKNFNNVLSVAAATQKTDKNISLEWLHWLLLDGDKTIIRDYYLKAGPAKTSRTGLALMIEKKAAKWSVPPEYAGRLSNNWVTRAIDHIPENDLQELIINEILSKW